MKRLFTMAMIAVVVCLCVTDSSDAKSRTRSKVLKHLKEPKPVAVSEMSPEELKAARAEIEAHQKAVEIRHEKLLKQLYIIRAVAIKERAHETVEEVDELIADEKKLYEDRALKPAKDLPPR